MGALHYWVIPMGVSASRISVKTQYQNFGRILGPNPRIWMSFLTSAFTTNNSKFSMIPNLGIPRLSSKH